MVLLDTQDAGRDLGGAIKRALPRLPEAWRHRSEAGPAGQPNEILGIDAMTLTTEEPQNEPRGN